MILSVGRALCPAPVVRLDGPPGTIPGLRVLGGILYPCAWCAPGRAAGYNTRPTRSRRRALPLRPACAWTGRRVQYPAYAFSAAFSTLAPGVRLDGPPGTIPGLRVLGGVLYPCTWCAPGQVAGYNTRPTRSRRHSLPLRLVCAWTGRRVQYPAYAFSAAFSTLAPGVRLDGPPGTIPGLRVLGGVLYPRARHAPGRAAGYNTRPTSPDTSVAPQGVFKLHSAL